MEYLQTSYLMGKRTASGEMKKLVEAKLPTATKKFGKSPKLKVRAHVFGRCTTTVT